MRCFFSPSDLFVLWSRLVAEETQEFEGKKSKRGDDLDRSTRTIFVVGEVVGIIRESTAQYREPRAHGQKMR